MHHFPVAIALVVSLIAGTIVACSVDGQASPSIGRYVILPLGGE